MREYHFVFFNTGHIPLADVRQVYREIGLPNEAERLLEHVTAHSARLPVGSPELALLSRWLNERGIASRHRIERDYTQRELLAFPATCVLVKRAQVGEPAIVSGAEYDFTDACPQCLIGARQTTPMTQRASEFPKAADILLTYGLVYALSDRVMAALQLLSPSGLRALPILDRRTGRPLPWWQLLPDLLTPPMLPSSTGLEQPRPCPVCRRSGFFDDARNPLELHYRRSDLPWTEQPDLAWTWEGIGPGKQVDDFGPTIIPQSRLLITPRIAALLLALKVRSLDLNPVVFE